MTKRYAFISVFLILSLFLPASNSWSACTGPDMSSAGYCLYQGGSGVTGGSAAGASSIMAASNMYPYLGGGDEKLWYDRATADYKNICYPFFNSLKLLDVTIDDSTPLGRMLLDPKLNYETADPNFLTNLAFVEAKLINVRNTFAFDVSIGYPYDNPSEGQNYLLDTIKTLANIYIMAGDELLIDALEYRFSSDTIGIDRKLDEQICLLGYGKSNITECKATDTPQYKIPQYGAQYYYEKAVNSFVYGFSQPVGLNIYAADSFDDKVFSLFNLALERLSMTLREKSTRQFARQMAPDNTQEWNAARKTALTTLRDINTTTYLTTAASAQRLGLPFDDYNGDSLSGALNTIRKLGNTYINNLNPLGYDNRYVPMYDFEDLYHLAQGWLEYAKEAKSVNDAEKREFDAKLDALENEMESLNMHYTEVLSDLTGCFPPSSGALPDDPEVEEFIKCTGEAGGDLFDCSFVSMEPDAFDACINSKETGGVLEAKYRNIRDGHLRLDLARLNRQNILERINLENEQNNKLIKLKRKSLNTELAMLDDYYNKMKNARDETDTVTKKSVRTREHGHWGKSNKTKDHSTTETFYIKYETLKVNTWKEKELREITTDFEIEAANLDLEYKVKNLLLSEAEAEIEISLAANQKNSAIEDFDAAYDKKDAYLFLYEKALNQVRKYYNDKLPTMRILKSQAAIDLSEALNYTSHYAYLASKALEYKYVNPIVDEPVGGGRLRLTDLFKAQTPADIEEFMLKLNDLNTLNCPWGTFDPQYYTVSLAYNILGLTDRYLDPDGDGYAFPGKTIADARREQVQAFISSHISSEGRLDFSFTLSEDNTFLANSGLYNMKIWNGPAPESCDTLVSDVKGVAVSLITTQTSNLRPRINLRQIGHTTLRNSDGNIAEYIPVSDYHMLFEESGDAYIPVKEADFIAFINTDPRYQSGMGSWTGAFKGRGIASSDWELTVYDWNPMYANTDLGKVRDLWIHIDTIGECCY